MGILLQPRQTGSPNSCQGGFQFWTCQASSTQSQYSGCCSVDACQNGGSCPPGNQQPGTGSSRSSTTTSTRTPSSPTTSQTTRSSVTTTTTGSTPTGSTPTGTTLPASTPTPSTTSTNGQAPTPTGPPSPSPTSSPGSSSPAIIGGAVAGVIVFVLLLLALLYIRRNMRRREHGTQPPYGPVYSDKPSGILGFFSRKRDDENRNSMALDTPNAQHNLFSFKKRPVPLDSQAATREGRGGSGTPLSPSDVGEMPSPSFLPPRINIDLPFDHAELESAAASGPSELSSTPLGGYRGSGSSAWSPPPSNGSFSSTAAVLSPQRETHYSESSSQAESRLSGGSSSQGGDQAHAPLRGGGWPTMRPNLHSLRRPVPNQNLQQVQAQSNSGAGQTGGQDGQVEQNDVSAADSANRHVMSWMEYGTGEPRGVI